MRIFIAIDIDETIRHHIARFVEGVRGFAPDVRWVKPESFHITLKFIGEQSPEQIEQIKRALAGVRGAPTTIGFRGTGFFPNPKAARVFWIGMEADAHLAALAANVDEATAALGIPAEERAFSPHLTLARSGSGAPRRKPSDRTNPSFKHLQEKLAAMPPPDFGTMTAREFFLYESKLSPSGARYTKLQGFALE
jgi:RNA 2',3'-cyclic 3'-phosphodiesterase